MRTTTSRKTPSHLRLRKTGLALLLSLACGLFGGTAYAQWLVYDATNNTTNQAGFLKQLQQTVQQYQQQLLEYQQLLSQITGLNTNMSLLPNQLQPIGDPSSLISANCSGASGGGVLGTVMNSVTSLFSQPISQAQQQICAQIVTTEIDKYNKTVTMLNEMGNYNSMFQQLQQVGQSISTLADSGRANNQAQVYSSALSTEMSNWQAQMQADDAIINTLQQQQQILARVALNGTNNSILSDALPDTTFQAVMATMQ